MRAIAIVLLLSFACPVLRAQDDWQLKRDEKGIKVYTRSSENSNFKSIKVDCIVNATAPQLVAFLLDVDRQCDWVCNYKCSKLVKKVCDSEIIFYSEVSVPWPCANRDYVSHITFTQPYKGFVVITAHSEPDLVPRQEGKVRVVKSNARWEVTSVSPGQQHIVYTVEFDPAGSVPAWLVNMFVTKAPYETFEKLRKGVSLPQYQNAHLAFIKE
jgi:START domain-containing protein